MFCAGSATDAVQNSTWDYCFKKTSQGMVTLITYLLEIILHSTDIILLFPVAKSEENTLGHVASFFHTLTVFREEELPYAYILNRVTASFNFFNRSRLHWKIHEKHLLLYISGFATKSKGIEKKLVFPVHLIKSLQKRKQILTQDTHT